MKIRRLILYSIFILFGYDAIAQQQVLNRLKTKVLIVQEKYDMALDMLQNSISSQKTDNTIFCEIGDCQYHKQDYNHAIINYLKADSILQNSSSFELARCYAAIGDNSNSLLWLEKHLKGNQKKTELEIVSDPVFATISHINEWKEFWKKPWYSETETEINAISALLAKGELNEALNELDTYQTKISPKHTYYALQAKAYDQQNLPDQSLLSITQAIEKHSLSDDYLSFRALLFLKTGKYPQALDDISKAIKLNPLTPSYYLKRAEIARLAGDMKMAESDLKIYQELYPESVETNHQLGLLEEAKGNHLTALSYYDKVIEKDASKPAYFLERGKIALDAKQIEKADQDFGMALDLDPHIAEAYLQKGNTRQILQDSEGACYCWKKAKQYGNAEAAKLIYQNCKEENNQVNKL